MNLREGTRRLALLLGAAGAILCGVLAYAQLQSTIRQKADYLKFGQLAGSPIASQARNSCFGETTNRQTDKLNQSQKLPAPGGKGPSKHGPWEKYQASGKIPEDSAAPPETLPADFFDPHQPFCYLPVNNSNAADFTAAESNSAGIKAVHFENHEITSIDTQDGQTLYPTPAPGVWSYLLTVILPILGFLIPWGAVRAVGWVLVGFIHP